MIIIIIILFLRKIFMSVMEDTEFTVPRTMRKRDERVIMRKKE